MTLEDLNLVGSEVENPQKEFFRAHWWEASICSP